MVIFLYVYRIRSNCVGALPKDYVEQQQRTPMTNSFVHLHLGIDATGLPKDLESHCEYFAFLGSKINGND